MANDHYNPSGAPGQRSSLSSSSAIRSEFANVGAGFDSVATMLGTDTMPAASRTGKGHQLVKVKGDASGLVATGITVQDSGHVSPLAVRATGAGNWGSIGAATAGGSFQSYLRAGTETPGGYVGFDAGGIVGGGTGNGFGIRSEEDLLLMAGAAERVRVNAAGFMSVGWPSSPTGHIIAHPVQTLGNTQVAFPSTGTFYVGDSGGENAAATVLSIKRVFSTGRSINAAGTINASGADYAEYMRKAEGCGPIAKGAIVGVNAKGLLTDKWADAVSFVVKSTDPSYVGGDVWGSEESLGMKAPVAPVSPGAEPAAPVRARFGEGEDGDRAYAEASGQHPKRVAEHRAAVAAYSTTKAAYDVHQDAFHAKLEEARQWVDRIAYAGQVPVNVTGAKPGDYIVPVETTGGIGGASVERSAITLEQYMAAVGIVQNILPDGRANVRVKVA